MNIGNIPIGTSVLALCPQTMQLSRSLTTALDSAKGPATNNNNSSEKSSSNPKKTDEKCYL